RRKTRTKATAGSAAPAGVGAPWGESGASSACKPRGKESCSMTHRVIACCSGELCSPFPVGDHRSPLQHPMTLFVVRLGRIAALLLPLAQFLFFLGAFLLFFLPLLGGAGVGLGFAFQFSVLLLLVGKRLGGAVEGIRQIVDGVAQG